MARDTRARMLATTARLLRHHGYHGTSLSDVLEESGAPRGSLYFHFPGGKDQLVIEATRAAVELTTRELREALAEARPDRAVRAYAEAAASILRETDYAFGCPVAPVVLDGADGLAELDELCRRAFEEWVSLLRQAFVAAGVARRRAGGLALLIVSSIEGGLLIARAYRDVGPVLELAAEIEALAQAAMPRTRPPEKPRGLEPARGRRRRPAGRRGREGGRDDRAP